MVPQFVIKHYKIDLESLEYTKTLEETFTNWTELNEHMQLKYGSEFIDSWIMEIMAKIPVATSENTAIQIVNNWDVANVQFVND